MFSLDVYFSEGALSSVRVLFLSFFFSFLYLSLCVNLFVRLRIKISDKAQRFDVAMTSFSSEKIKFKLTSYIQCEVITT